MSVSVQLTNAGHTELVWVKRWKGYWLRFFSFCQQFVNCWFRSRPWLSFFFISFFFLICSILVIPVAMNGLVFCVLVRLKTSKALYVLLQGRRYNPKTQDNSLYSTYIMLRHQESATRWKAAVAEPETKPRCCAFYASSSLTPFPPGACFVCIHFQFSMKKDKKAGIHLP